MFHTFAKLFFSGEKHKLVSAGFRPDGFQVKDGSAVLCEWFDPVPGNAEVWDVFECAVNFEGVKTLTIHPTAASPWAGCDTWGQVAISNIESHTCGGDVPEFTTIGAGLALLGAGLYAYRKRK